MLDFGYTVDPEKRDSSVLDERIGAPGAAKRWLYLSLYLDEEEVDDDIHMPQSDDDERLKPKFPDIFAPNRLLVLFGLVLMLVGLCCVSIQLPVLGATGAYDYSYSYYSGEPEGNVNKVEPWAHVNNVKFALLRNIRTG